nr:hypothetical protein [uncultured Porphyromonas sp.]
MKYTYRFYLLLLATTLIGTSNLWGQASSDAYRNVQNGVTGTARTKAIGGAAGAIGADAGAVYTNPAGLALLSRSTFGIGMDFGKDNSSVTTGDQTIGRTLGLSALNNISYFSRGYHIPTNGDNYLKLNYGISYGREYNYKRDYEMNSFAPRFSITDLISGKANYLGLGKEAYIRTKTYDPFQSNVNPMVALALNGDIIEFAEVKDNATGNIISQGYNTKFNDKETLIPWKIRSSNLNVSERGHRNYTDFNLGMNLNDRYFFGAALRLGTMTYSRASMLREDFDDRKDNNNSYLEYGTSLDVTGSSIALNLGFLMAIGDYGRIGISYLTPQYAQYKELYSGTVASWHNGIKNPKNRYYTFPTDEYRSEYGMITPGKLTISAMAFLSKYGMVSYDFQYRNLGHSKILLSGAGVSGVSDFIKEDYGAELTHRVGLEVRPINWLSLRTGYAYTGNPLKSEPLKKEAEGGLDYEYPASGMIADFILPRSYQAITGGIGFNIGRSTTLDLAYVHEIRKEKAYPFTGWTDPKDPEKSFIAVKGGDLKETRGSFVANLTFRF